VKTAKLPGLKLAILGLAWLTNLAALDLDEVSSLKFPKPKVEKTAAQYTDDEVRQALRYVCDVVSKQLPVSMDSETRWDSILPFVHKGQRLMIYSYTLPNIEIDPGKRDVAAKIIKDLKPGVVAAFNTSEQGKEFRRLGVSARYTYRDSIGAVIGEFDVP